MLDSQPSVVQVQTMREEARQLQHICLASFFAHFSISMALVDLRILINTKMTHADDPICIYATITW